MKKLLLLFACFGCYANVSMAQKPIVDSLKRAYAKDKQDTTLVKLLDAKSIITYVQTNTDSGLICAQRGLAISRRLHYTWGEMRSLANLGYYLNVIGDLPGALRVSFENIPRAQAANDDYTLNECYSTLASAYATLNDFEKSKMYFHKALFYALRSGIYESVFSKYDNLSALFFEHNQLDSALWYTNKAYEIAVEKKLNRHIAFVFMSFGAIEFQKGNYIGAINFYNKSLAEKGSQNNQYLKSEDFRRKAQVYQKLNKPDSAVLFAQQAYHEALIYGNPRIILSSATLLTTIFSSQNNFKQAFYYQQLAFKAQDSLFNRQKTLQIKNLEYNELQHRAEIKAAQEGYRYKVRFFALSTIIGVFAIVAVVLVFANRSRKKANNELEKALNELKNTQTQLIQSAKMASLGEVTAGIAHEIQNPLNFVNNFSDVNKELLQDLKAETDINFAVELIDDIIANEEKINQHGKRADGIVKAMLQHSRTTSGQKEQVDLNLLSADYLSLAYHGFKAKDQKFEAEVITDFTADMPQINVVQQDISRVLLNLFNNAFYAVYQETKTAGPTYKAKVTLTTKVEKQNVVIIIKDNGAGIPDSIYEKIMQPFFTTKPTGEGIGLGLSISYDIVTQGHNGNLEAKKKTGGAEFILTLPLV